MVAYERYVIVVLCVVCAVSAWPQYRSNSRSDMIPSERAADVRSRIIEDNERAVWPDEDRQVMKSFSTPATNTNNPRPGGSKSRTGRTQNQDGVTSLIDSQSHPSNDATFGSRAHQSHGNQSQLMLQDAPRQTGRNGGSGRTKPSPHTPLAMNATGDHEGRGLMPARANGSREDSEEATSQDATTRGDGRFVPSSAKGNQPQWGRTKPHSTGIFPANSRVKRPQQSDIVFPGPQESDSIRFIPRVEGERPRCASGGNTYCLDGDDYPRDYLNNILQNQQPVFRTYFITDKVPEENNITQRFDDTSDDMPLCPSQEHIVFPKIAQNKDNEWLYVVNHEEYKQGVRIEKCGREDQSCAYSDGFPRAIRSFCKQKYIFRQMLSVNQQGMPSPDTFKLPSCCSCHTMSVDAVSRMGMDPSNQTPAPKRPKRMGMDPGNQSPAPKRPKRMGMDPDNQSPALKRSKRMGMDPSNQSPAPKRLKQRNL